MFGMISITGYPVSARFIFKICHRTWRGAKGDLKSGSMQITW